jgi:hypothetical protein
MIKKILLTLAALLGVVIVTLAGCARASGSQGARCRGRHSAA